MENINLTLEWLEQFVLDENLTIDQRKKIEEIYLTIQRQVAEQQEQMQTLKTENERLNVENEYRKMIIWENPTTRKQVTEQALTIVYESV